MVFETLVVQGTCIILRDQWNTFLDNGHGSLIVIFHLLISSCSNPKNTRKWFLPGLQWVGPIALEHREIPLDKPAGSRETEKFMSWLTWYTKSNVTWEHSNGTFINQSNPTVNELMLQQETSDFLGKIYTSLYVLWMRVSTKNSFELLSRCSTQCACALAK